MRIFSNIKADYMLQNFKNDLTFHIFIEKRSNSDNQFCKSFFENSVKDYSRGQTKMTLLYKEKLNKCVGKSEILYNKLD